ncbi:MAG: amidohydrolase family protein [Calditrichaeota bacterium]|nr:amidohydrolase family protein [Calditrichota bacterium]
MCVKKCNCPGSLFAPDAYRPTGLMSKRHPHPRAYGTFPRVLSKYVREEKVLTLEQAIYKMSGLPAMVLRLKDRGLIKEGYAADIVIFNPDSIKDKATYLQPHQFPEGIQLVMVNGKIVVKNGKTTGEKPGRALLKTKN